MYIVYATRDDKKGIRVGQSCCPVCPDCYLCEFEKCRTYAGTCERRIEVRTPAQMEKIKQRMKMIRIIQIEG